MIELKDIGFLQTGEPWPPPEHLERLKRYDDNKKMFKGEHDQVFSKAFLDRIRDDEYWKEHVDEDIVELIINFPKSITLLYADLLFGEEPRYKPKEDDESQQQWIDNFALRNRMRRTNYMASLSQSYRGESLFKLRLQNGESMIDVLPAKYWFPVVADNDINDILAHVIAYRTDNVGDISEADYNNIDPKDDNQDGVTYLNIEIHQAGRIDYHTIRLRSGKIGEVIDSEVEETNVNRPLIFHIPNLELDDEVFGMDDYSDNDSLFAELDTRASQISKILDKHSDPNMYGPPRHSEIDPDTGSERVQTGGNYFEVNSDEEPPAYMTWEAKLDANFKQIETILNFLYITTDTNQAAFSLIESGNIPSGSAMERLLMRTVAKTNRKWLFFGPELKLIFLTANQLERNNGNDVPELTGIEIDRKDGLPDDPKENAEIERIRTGGKATSSQCSSVKRLDGGSQESIDEELQRIKEDEQRAQPPGVAPTTFGETGEGE